ncbi:MAG TPA: MFS transporter, partial [Firmicutes bacterium]|nr:MFS transporter [Bacillota bacterium]
MKTSNQTFRDLQDFLILWLTQSFSSFGSALTSFTLVIWSYQQEGSALTTALLSVSSYAPYVLMSIFAGALSDRWDKKRTMFVSDSFAALCTLVVLVLLKTGNLRIGHLYVLNALNGLMNTVQGPASTVAVSLLVPKEHYQRVSGLQSFSNALVTVLTPVVASAMLMFFGPDAVILF